MTKGSCQKNITAASDTLCAGIWQGRRQSLMKKPLRDGEPEEDGQERAVAMRSRGPARGVAMAGQDGGELARRSARRYRPHFCFRCIRAGSTSTRRARHV